MDYFNYWLDYIIKEQGDYIDDILDDLAKEKRYFAQQLEYVISSIDEAKFLKRVLKNEKNKKSYQSISEKKKH